MSVKPKRTFPIREAAVATPATKDEFQDARFIGPNYPSPCSDMVIATQTAVVRAASSSTRTLKFIPLEHTVEDVQALCHLPKSQHPQVSQRGAGEGSFRRGTTLQVQPIRVSAAVPPKEGRQVPRGFQQCRPPRGGPLYLVGATPKGLSVFRTGNAMCENFEVSEVLGISRRRNSCHCPPGTRAQSGLRFPFPRRRTRVPRRIRTRDGAGSREL